MRSPRGLFLLLAPLATAVLAWSSYEVVRRQSDSLASRLYWQQRTEVQRVVEHLDAAIATIVDREAAIPYEDFQPYIAHPQAITARTFTTAEAPLDGLNETLYLPSPLLVGEGNFPNLGLDLLYFEFAPRDIHAATILDDVSAPSVPRGREAELALELGHTTAARLDAEKRKLEALVRVIGPDGLVALASHPALNFKTPLKWSRSFTPLFVPRLDGRTPELWLLRLVDSRDRGVRLQGVWFNWTALEGALVELAADKLESGRVELTPRLGGGAPDADPSDRADFVNRAAAPPLESTTTNSAGTLKNLSLGVTITERTPPPPPGWNATYTSLLGAWVVFLCALGAIDFALRRALALSERRARFASAVTHELRTPLTTLCMYAEMLEAGLVPAEEHASYYWTLKQEADRLAALVDNVLDHAGLESGRSTTAERLEAIELGSWLADWVARDTRAEPAWPITLSDLPADLSVRAEPQGLERILTNLVSNARRYGGEPIELAVTAAPDAVHIEVRDGGPGVADPAAIFEAFVRGAESGRTADAGAANRTPQASSSRGLGLGLALARDLARAMGGDLTLTDPGPRGATPNATADTSLGKNADRTHPPTTFRLTLPRAQA